MVEISEGLAIYPIASLSFSRLLHSGCEERFKIERGRKTKGGHRQVVAARLAARGVFKIVAASIEAKS